MVFPGAITMTIEIRWVEETVTGYIPHGLTAPKWVPIAITKPSLYQKLINAFRLKHAKQ
jgi:hypothetical protein